MMKQKSRNCVKAHKTGAYLEKDPVAKLRAKKISSGRILAIALSLVFLGSCTEKAQKPESQAEPKLAEFIDDNIANYATVSIQQSAPIRGFGIVAGLRGTGSSECPAELKEPLTKQILQNVPDKRSFDAQDFLNSKNTAVVVVYGMLPEMPLPDESFDLKIAAHPATQTTSLLGGSLYTTELTEFGRLSRNIFQYDPFYTRPLAQAAGPIYLNANKSDPDLSRGYILGGGKVIEKFVNRLAIKEPSYLVAAAIRDRINERFGPKTATAISYREVRLKIPPTYYSQKDRFIEMLMTLHIRPSETARKQRIQNLVNQMQRGENLENAEIALSGIGKPAMQDILGLLDHNDEKVRFHAARCIADIGSDIPLNTFRAIVKNPRSAYRVQAVEALGQYMTRDQAVPTLTESLSMDDFEVRFAAYMQLKRLGDVTIRSTLVADEFLVDNVICAGPKVVFISQKKVPKIVIFGGPLYCSNDIFVSTDDGTVTLNSVPGQGYVSLMRKHPNRPKILGPLRSSYKFTDLIKTLCESPEVSRKSNPVPPGLGITYAEMVPIVMKLVRSGALDADLEIQPITQAGEIVEKMADNDR